MIEKIKQRFGQSVQVLSVQEYFKGQWFKYNSTAPINEQINECIGLGASIISFHITTEEEDEETGKAKTVNVYPDVKVI